MPDVAVRDAIRAQYQEEMASLSAEYAAGDISLDNWHEGMKTALRDSYALNLRAGADAPLKYTDYLQLGNPLQKQYRFLADFKQSIADGALSGGAIATRAKLYALSAVQMYWRQVTRGAELPAYPGDGTSDCLTNCGCEWVEAADGWHWVRSKDDSCDTCLQREQEWNPYVADGGE